MNNIAKLHGDVNKNVANLAMKRYNVEKEGSDGFLNRKRTKSSDMALGGIFAALAVVVMSLGGLIPAATFICPMICMILLKVVLQRCDNRVGWAWYGAVAILGLLLGPDKEAAAVFVFLGYYPIIKPKLDTLPLRWLWKLIYFNVVILLMYWLLMNLFGMTELVEDFQELGVVMTGVTLLMGNVTFLMLDYLLGVRLKLRKRHG